MKHSLLAAAASVVFFCVQIAAQQSPAVVGGTISGRIICTDTNTPARFAKVLLKSVEPDHAGEDMMKRMEDSITKSVAKNGLPTQAAKPQTEAQKRAGSAAAKSMNQAMDMLNASTVGMDGEYSFAGVKPGTYYVHVMFAGYIDPLDQFSDDDLASTESAVRARIAARVPTITISGTESSHVDLRLDRGASVSGRVLFDDGSPAAGWIVSTVAPKSPEDLSPLAATALTQQLALGTSSIAKTDDLGRYRISGLPGGSYALRTTLNASPIGISATNMADGGSNINLVVYSGNTFVRSDAKAFSVNVGDDRPGVDLIIPDRKLHSIVGHVYAKSDDHTLNVGDISLTSKEEPTLALTAAVRDDGSFRYNYLPSGTYTLKVKNAADGQTTGSTSFMGISMPKQEILHKYGTDSTEIILNDADIDSVRFTLAQTDWTPPAKKPGSGDVDPGALLGNMLGSAIGGALNNSDDQKIQPAPTTNSNTK